MNRVIRWLIAALVAFAALWYIYWVPIAIIYQQISPVRYLCRESSAT